MEDFDKVIELEDGDEIIGYWYPEQYLKEYDGMIVRDHHQFRKDFNKTMIYWAKINAVEDMLCGKLDARPHYFMRVQIGQLMGHRHDQPIRSD